MSHTALLLFVVSVVVVSNAEAAPQGTARTPILFSKLLIKKFDGS